MSNQYRDLDDEKRMMRRAQRIEEMRRSKRRQALFRKILRKFGAPVVGIIGAIILISVGGKIFHKSPDNPTIEAEASDNTDTQADIALENSLIMGASLAQKVQETDTQQPQEETSALIVYSATKTDNTTQLGDDVVSTYGLLIDLDTDTILASRDEKAIISPASMTKILTILVAAEHVTNLDDTFTITIDITDYSFVNDCSNVGFAENETVTVRDLFYGTILPSGGDAAVGLATYVAGSQEAFVEMMNEKVRELGLSDTAHFTNCVGIYDKEHYCTVYDMAMILEAALDNELCKEVLSAHTYTTSSTPEHPEGITISNWFLRRIEDKDSGGEVVCGKTGYVVESGSCAASYAEDANGKGYICVTDNSTSSWRCIYDHVAIYKRFMGD